jgi:hypothetical protein
MEELDKAFDDEFEKQKTIHSRPISSIDWF